jgi:hypothetical protein
MHHDPKHEVLGAGLFADGTARLPEEALARRGSVFAGIGCAGRRGVSVGLPLDAIVIPLAAESSRRAYGKEAVVLLVADAHAMAVGADTDAVREVATVYATRMRAVCALLCIPKFEVILASDLDRDPDYRAILLEARQRESGHSDYFIREAADIEYMRRFKALSLKVGWTLGRGRDRRLEGTQPSHERRDTSATSPTGTDEPAFDRHYVATFPEGAGTGFLYTGPGITLDPTRAVAVPYVESDGARRIMLRRNEDVATKLESCPAEHRRTVVAHYERLLRAWESFAGPLGSGRLEARIATLLTRIVN